MDYFYFDGRIEFPNHVMGINTQHDFNYNQGIYLCKRSE